MGTDHDGELSTAVAAEVSGVVAELQRLMAAFPDQGEDELLRTLDRIASRAHQLRGAAPLGGIQVEPAAERIENAARLAAMLGRPVGPVFLRDLNRDLDAVIHAVGSATSPEPPRAPPAASTGGVVLCIDDSHANRLIVERLLGRRGVHVQSAETGTDGLRLARELHPELILLDLHLPDLSGEEVLRRLRSDPATADAAVVVVSADATPHRVAQLTAAGAAAYLTKPLDLNELAETVGQHLGRDD